MPAEVLAAPGRLVVTPHPVTLDGQRNVVADLRPGESLAEFLGRHVPGIDSGAWAVSIGGLDVPQAMWRHTFPKHGQLISCRASVHKTVLKIVAIAALAYFTMGAGLSLLGAATGLTGAALAVTGVGLFVAGSIIINKVLGPKVPNAGAASSLAGADVYSLSSQRNSARAYAPIGTLLGEMRVTPDLAGQPYTYFESDDQYLTTILLGGINVDSYADLSVGDTPLSSFSAVTVYTNGFSGMASEDVPLFSNADSLAGGVLEDTTAWVTRTSSVNAVMLQIDLEYQLFRQGEQGLEPASLTLQAEYRQVGAGSWDSYATQTVTNKTTETRRVTWTIPVPSGQYEVRVRRTNGPNPEGTTRTVQWSTLRTIQPDTTDYSGWGRIGIRIKATGQLSGSLDTVRATFKPRPLPVWNGSAWANATTRPGVSNPGALILQVLRGIWDGDVLQFGYGLSDDQIDVEGLKGFILHCTASGFTYDRWITEPISLGNLLEEIALAGMGQFMWLDGSRPTVRWAADDQPLGGVVNMANMSRGSFAVSYQLANAADGIEYQYVDRARNFETVTLRVMAPGVTTMLNPARLTGVGVTTEAHAAVLARYHLGQSLYQYKEIGFGADIERLDYQRMSMLSLSHDMTQWGYGGRLVGAEVDGGSIVLTLDEPVPSLPSRFVGLRVPGERDYRVFSVESFTGPSNQITLIGSWPAGVAFPGDTADNPAHDTLWCYDVKATPGYRVRVVSIEPDSDLNGASVRCVPESDEFWDYVLTGAYVPAPSESLIPQLEAPAVSNIRVTDQPNSQGNTEWVQFNVVWDSTGDLSHCQVWAAINGEPLRMVDGQALGNRSSFRVDENGEWQIEVRPFDTRGVAGTADSVLYDTELINRPPANVDVFSVDELEGGVRRYRFGYTSLTPPAVYAGVQIRYRAGATAIVLGDWDSLTPLGRADDIYTSAPESMLPAPGEWTFACRAISTSGALATSIVQVTRKLSTAEAANLIPNPTSEMGSIPGVGGNNVLYAPGIAFSGEYVRHMPSPGGSLALLVLSEETACADGDQFVVEAQVITSPTNSNGILYASFKNGAGTEIATPGVAVVANDTYYVKGAVRVTAPSGARSVVFAFRSSFAADYYLDDLRATRVSQAVIDAAADAEAALDRLDAIDDDGILSRGEKPQALLEWQAISGEQSGIYDQGTAYGLITLRNAFGAAVDGLEAYLNSLVPDWDDTSVDTPIVAASWLAAWTTYYAARQGLLNAIDDEAAKRAEWANVGGSGKPEDNATRNRLFKQDADPAAGGGDVQDGDRWQQTTSGVVTAVWDRIGGAWSNGPAGPAGTPGESVYVATVYLQTGSPPSAPTGGTFNFSTGVFVPPSGWSASQPATTTTPTYAAEYPFSTTTPSVTVTAGTWTTPVVDAVAGSSGTAGAAVFTVEIYLQTGGGAPSAPSGGSYTFTGDSLTPPSGWTRNKPASSTTPTYRCGYTFSTTAPGTPVAAGTWSTPVVVAQNGEDGADGDDAIGSGLTLAAFALPADSTGLVSSYTGCTTTMTVSKGMTDDTANWSFSRADSSGVTSALSGANNNVLTVSAMATGTDAGTVTITATRSGYPTQVRVFGLSKSKSARPASGAVESPGFFSEVANSTSPTDASCWCEFRRNGTVYTGYSDSGGSGSSYVGDWYLPNGTTVGDGFDVRFDLVTSSGNSGGNGGTLSSWQQIDSSNPRVTVTTSENTFAARGRLYSYTIRDRTSLLQVSAGQISLNAEVEP